MTTDDDRDRNLPLPVAGVWRREWEEDPLGDVDRADRDTLVLWTQSRTSGVYVDIRIPAELVIRSPRRDATQPNPLALAARESVTDLTTTHGDRRTTDAALLPLLLRQKSFAGVLRCTPGDTTDGTALRRDEVLASLAAEWRQRRINGDGKSEGKGEGGSEGLAKSTQNSRGDDDGGGDGIGLCTCYWRRDLDYQPPTGEADVGVCASDPSSLDVIDGSSTFLRETGADGSYAEGWRRIGGTENGPFMALRLISSEEDGMRRQNASREGCWVRAGRYFAYAVGRPTDAVASTAFGCPVGTERIGGCVGDSLTEAVKNIAAGGTEEDALRMAFGYVCVFGEIVDDDSEADRGGSGEVWRIRHSINPDLVGCHLVGDVEVDPLCCSRLLQVSEEHSSSSEAHPSVVEQTLRDGGGKRRWRVVELDGCDLPLS